MILRCKLATLPLLAVTAALGACVGGPLEPPTPTQVREASYICTGGHRLNARFEYGTQRTLFVGTTDLDGRVLNAPKNTVLLIPAGGEPMQLVQAPPPASQSFYYRADGGYGFTGQTAGRAILTTPSGTVVCDPG